MKKILILFVALSTFGTPLKAQRLALEGAFYTSYISSYQKLSVPFGALSFQYFVSKNDKNIIGVGYRSVPYGNEVYAEYKYRIPLFQMSKINLFSENGLRAGLPLFHNKSAFSGSISASLILKNNRFKRGEFIIGGVYTTAPGLNDFQRSNSFIHGMLGFRYRLGRAASIPD